MAMSALSRKRLVLLASAAFALCALRLASAASADAIPDISGQWGRNVLNLEAPASGTGPIFNLNKNADGTYNNDVPVGDYMSPVLRPEAVRVLRERGEISLDDRAFPSPHNQCWPEPTPFVLSIQWGMNILQSADEVAFLYLSDHQVRRVPLSVTHPEGLAPSWQGHSVGHYEGDTWSSTRSG
jgi:hypothetical protein